MPGRIQAENSRWQRAGWKREWELQLDVSCIWVQKAERDLGEDFHLGAGETGKETWLEGSLQAPCRVHGIWDEQGNWTLYAASVVHPLSPCQRISQVWFGWRKPCFHSARRWKRRLKVQGALFIIRGSKWHGLEKGLMEYSASPRKGGLKSQLHKFP